MQMFRLIEQDTAELVGWGVQVLLLSDPLSPATALVQRRIAGVGGKITVQATLAGASAWLHARPDAFGLLVMACDDFGGIEAGMQALAQLRAAGVQLPAILIAADCPRQVFPAAADAPVQLRAPLSAVSLHVGVEHALRRAPADPQP